ncbi:MAG: Rho termination factor N-terminal domain-containing protein [Solirubrobacteraceae bacterium]
MAVLNREALEASPLADLHAIASELGLDGFRRLRKADLISRILEETGGEASVSEEVVDEAAADAEARPRRRSRGGRGRGRNGDGAAVEEAEEAEEEQEARPRRGRGGRGNGDAAAAEERAVEGVVELLSNGSAFVRVSPPEPSDDDVYVSAAQVRRCELVSGDKVSGPVRPPRRSERYPSLVRVETINGAPVEEVAEGTPYDELPCAFPSVRLELGGEDPTLQTIDGLTPIGRGSRVVISGAARAGKTEALRAIAAALAAQEGLEVSVALAGVRPEEVADWQAGPAEVAAAASLAAGPDAQGAAIERAVETGRRIAARGGHAVLLIDTLDGVSPGAARRALAAARAIVDGGTLTVIATASQPVGGETTVIALDAARTAARAFPALDVAASGTLRPELLVGEDGAAAIARAHGDA